MEDNFKTDNTMTVKDLVKVIWRGRTAIIGIVVISVLMSYLVSNFILEKTYQSNTILLVSNAAQTPVSIENDDVGVDALLGTLSSNIPQTIATYREQLLTNEMLNKVIQELNLENQYDVGRLRKSITVSNIKDTNLLDIAVVTPDPDLSRDIANTLSSQFSDFVAEMNSKRLAESSQFLKEKVDEEKLKLNQALDEYKEFLKKTPGTQEIKSDINAKETRMITLKNELNTMKTTYTIDKAILEDELDVLSARERVLLKQYEDMAEVLKVNKSLFEDDFINDVVDEKGVTIQEKTEMILVSEVINPNYIEVENQLNEVHIDQVTVKHEIINLESRFTEMSEIYNEELGFLSVQLEELRVLYSDRFNEEKTYE